MFYVDGGATAHMLDLTKYGRLFAESLPAVITDESEYDPVALLMNKLAVIIRHY
mgnify:CR=1 FL=1